MLEVVPDYVQFPQLHCFNKTLLQCYHSPMTKKEIRTKRWWDDFWQDPSRNYGPPNETLIQYSREFKNGRKSLTAVDIASGDGRYALPLSKMGYETTAIDFSSNGIKRIQDLAERERIKVEVKLGDFIKLCKDEQKFDLVVCSGLLEEVGPNYHKNVVNGFMNWTKPEGLNIIKYCLEIKGRGQFVEDDLIPTLYENSEWKIVFQEEERRLRKSKAVNTINNRHIDSFIRTGTVIAVKLVQIAS